MSNKISLTFYQHPEALHEINAWKQLIKDKITKQSLEDESNFQMIDLFREDETYECMVIIPVIDENINFELSKKIIDYIAYKQDNGAYSYYKALLFGKFNSKTLDVISKFIKKYESK